MIKNAFDTFVVINKGLGCCTIVFPSKGSDWRTYHTLAEVYDHRKEIIRDTDENVLFAITDLLRKANVSAIEVRPYAYYKSLIENEYTFENDIWEWRNTVSTTKEVTSNGKYD